MAKGKDFPAVDFHAVLARRDPALAERMKQEGVTVNTTPAETPALSVVLDPEPIAVTPSAQVHRGVLEGRPVAVKLLRPGLASSVRQDLVLLEGNQAAALGAVRRARSFRSP